MTSPINNIEIPSEPQIDSVAQRAADLDRARQAALHANMVASVTRGKPRVLLMGQKRSGKSSISQVVFHKTPARDTLFLESTTQIQRVMQMSWMDFQVWDFPGQMDYLDPVFDVEGIFGQMGALIWVIDAQDDYHESLARLIKIINVIQPRFPLMNINVFVHKCDSIAEEYMNETKTDIECRLNDELADIGLEHDTVTYHMTSIYNHTIYRALSEVVQKLTPNMGILENLMDNLVNVNHFHKAYLFDVDTKIFVASDTTPDDLATLEHCSDFIDMVVDISAIYSQPITDEYLAVLEGPPWNQPLADQIASDGAEASVCLTQGNRPVMLREVNKFLCLVAVGSENSYDRMPILEQNMAATVKALKDIFIITKRAEGPV